ncbi:hypothetical protein Dimus_036795, partial [Dionaea muscipula]
KKKHVPVPDFQRVVCVGSAPFVCHRGMMQRSTTSSNNSAEVQNDNRSCCGNFGLEAWVSHTTKNYKRPYWRCKHCGQFVRWVEADFVIEFKELSMRLAVVEEKIKECSELKNQVCQLREQIAENDAALKEFRQSVGAVNYRFVIMMAITLFVLWYLIS